MVVREVNGIPKQMLANAEREELVFARLNALTLIATSDWFRYHRNGLID